MNDLDVTIRAVAIAVEMDKSKREGTFGQLQKDLKDLGYYLELRKPKKDKKQILLEGEQNG